MYCVKCGKETKNGNVFCDDCLLVMQTQPVKPGTAVHIPIRPTPAKKPAARKKVLSPEEQNLRLRKIIRRLVVAVACLALSLGVAVGSLLYVLHKQAEQDALGKNYSTVTSEGTP